MRNMSVTKPEGAPSRMSSAISRVYLIVALFVAIIICLVFFSLIQMDVLTSVRAYVGGEGLWAKAQKDAIRSLEHYANSRDEADYRAYQRLILVPLGDQQARIELQKPDPDLDIARAGFIQGRNHPVDVEYEISFFRRFQHIAYMSQAIGHWAAADQLIAELNGVADVLHQEITTGRGTTAAIRSSDAKLDALNLQLTEEEDQFSSTLAEASRWVNDISRNISYVIALLFIALGIVLSFSIIARIRRTEMALLEAQENMVRSEKLSVLGQVAGSVGHELRNPLGVMSNAVYFLQTVLSDADATTKEYLDIIKNEIAASERIVSDLLDSVRTKPPRPEMLGVRELLEKTLGKCAVPDTVTVKLVIPETLSPLHVDAQQIHQVFRNLISNGIEAMPEGGTLEIQADVDAPDQTITISVKDSGSGIVPEVLANLFQPLFTTKARGIGLGLVVVKNLTQANGGTVKVESKVGKGTLFAVTLPAADETDY